MPRKVHDSSVVVMSSEGIPYGARILGEAREDGTWEGWIEFVPAGHLGPVRITGRETTQPNLAALEYWAGGLEPVYFEGAMARARARA